VLAFVFTPTTSFTERQLAIAACDVLGGGGGITTPLKKKITRNQRRKEPHSGFLH